MMSGGGDHRLSVNPFVTAERMATGGVLMDTASGECFELNHTGIQVWEAIARDGTVAGLVSELATRHGLDERRIGDDVCKVLEEMLRRGLIRSTR